jgi:hypothetical protein
MSAADWEIVVVEGQPKKAWRSANVEARNLAKVVPVEVAAKWKRVRVEMTTGLARRVREDRN